MLAIRPAMTAAGRWLRSVRPERAHLRADLVAALPGAISRVPDGMAAAVLAGVNPVQGLYASFAGPIVGGLSSNTRMMVISTTSAAALAAGSALQNVPPDQRPAAISLLDMCERERRHFGSSEAATEKYSEDRAITKSLCCRDVRRAQERLSLPRRQPVPDANPGRFDALHTGNAGC